MSTEANDLNLVGVWVWEKTDGVFRFIWKNMVREFFSSVRCVSEREVEEPPGPRWRDWKFGKWITTGTLRVTASVRNASGYFEDEQINLKDTPELRQLLGLGPRQTPVPYRPEVRR